MFLKAAFKNSPLFVQLLMLLAVVVFGSFFASLLVQMLIITKEGASIETFNNVFQNLLNYPDILRGMQFFQALGLFLIPAIICAWLFSDNYKEYLGIDKPVSKRVVIFTIVSVIVAIPFLNMMVSINQQMIFPESLKELEQFLKEMEEAASRSVEVMLDTKNVSTIGFNFLTVCVVAAICEELLFRGLLQTLFGRMIKNPHILIWMVAILFSAFHLQFYGFIPRMLLGAWLGYLMYFTKSIWAPVLAHFTNNLISIGLFYIFQDKPDEIQKFDTLGTDSTWWLSFASLALFFFCFSLIKKAIKTAFEVNNL